MNHDQHDDGLVHSHGWATEPPPSVGDILRGLAPREATRIIEEAHDDGLVHGHGWACSERGGMAGP
ncbi:hypothetical protein [Roseomonas sp. AR75]|uniref:hypothetical protein n=1 Tax=Roseomonas sp. AR75 TaxID=2562311 RepID=UPI0010C0DBF0|nr:hypothetical protein [Roseomonas sp. AR75]